MLELRPHHLIDIIRNIGHDRPLVVHPYGHAQHLVTRHILDGSEKLIRLVVRADDLCQPCIHRTTDGLCDDLLSQFDFPVEKQEYNNKLDRHLLEFLELDKDQIIALPDFLRLIRSRLDELIPVCLHPKEDIGYKREGLRKGLSILMENKI